MHGTYNTKIKKLLICFKFRVKLDVKIHQEELFIIYKQIPIL